VQSTITIHRLRRSGQPRGLPLQARSRLQAAI